MKAEHQYWNSSFNPIVMRRNSSLWSCFDLQAGLTDEKKLDHDLKFWMKAVTIYPPHIRQPYNGLQSSISESMSAVQEFTEWRQATVRQARIIVEVIISLGWDNILVLYETHFGKLVTCWRRSSNSYKTKLRLFTLL